ncbi:unnamed protein product [Symbiodinium necroappetens]|uniref:Uncharacterized protein n=1 Tax=Symbiodinium necroappetens TaxID=1628268 RepID=A0A812PZZ7_9DINO|nr:unnamed protein product [Symbiodinium necroappetens]
MSGDKMTRSATRGFGPLPAHWLSEQFTVVDAGYGQVAFYSAKWGRFIRLSGSKLKTTSKRAATNLPSHWASPRFTVLPAGHGTFVFHNTDENRMIRMTDKVMGSSATKDPQDLPDSWSWERFKIVVVSEATQKAEDVSWSFDLAMVPETATESVRKCKQEFWLPIMEIRQRCLPA